MKEEQKTSGKSLFLKGKAYGLLSLSLHVQATERYMDKGRRATERLQRSRAGGRWQKGGGEADGVKGAVFHLINNTNQIIQCSTVP